MKLRILLITLLLSSLATAAFEQWTSADGRTATMNLLSVTEVGGELVGRFSLRSGKVVELKAGDLSAEDAKRLTEWKPDRVGARGTGGDSVFDDFFEGNLLRLDGKTLESCDVPEPEKYYIFYYTASWCGPCQRYTPSLVKWYNENKNDHFEIVVITWDQNTREMKDYAVSKKMPWTILKQSKADDFQKKFPHQVSGIPSVITCGLDGKIVSRTESLAELGQLVK
ncbi:thioredoxin-like domain-containing protein [Haloferula sp. A504]|uniref:thioredoxin-like domain-containing protein n=1 Tax=Haloferula sp. A504 TaxID=3373601 RepID=UPI0031C93128|nr:thioredoxin domain-containing protein [Verrucomicrobiaceae bacterium E54]